MKCSIELKSRIYVLKYFNMSPLKKLKCSKLTVKLFFFLVLLTLALLILSNILWFPLSLVNSVSNFQNMIPKLSWKFQENVTIQANDPGTTITTPNMSDSIWKTQLKYEYIINEPDKCRDHAPFLVLLVTIRVWQREARQAIRNTWGKEDLLPGVKIVRLFLLGKDPKLNTKAKQALFQESQEFHDIIQQDYLDTYKNLTTKVLMGLTWIATYCPHALYIMKTDSDMFVNTEYLVNKLLKPDQEPKTNYFTGYLMLHRSPSRSQRSKWYVSPDVYPDKKYPPFCSGTGYVLSGDLAHKIVNMSPIVRWIHLEDVFIGCCLKKLEVKPVAPPKKSDFNALRVKYSDCRYRNLVTSHGVRPGDILHYWSRLQDITISCA